MHMKLERNTLEERSDIYYPTDKFDGNIDSIIQYLQEMKEAGWNEIVWDEDDAFYFRRFRLENDKEYNTRIEIQKKDQKLKKDQKNKAKENRKKMYERLKKEFENS